MYVANRLGAGLAPGLGHHACGQAACLQLGADRAITDNQRALCQKCAQILHAAPHELSARVCARMPGDRSYLS